LLRKVTVMTPDMAEPAMTTRDPAANSASRAASREQQHEWRGREVDRQVGSCAAEAADCSRGARRAARGAAPRRPPRLIKAPTISAAAPSVRTRETIRSANTVLRSGPLRTPGGRSEQETAAVLARRVDTATSGRATVVIAEPNPLIDSPI
jgi:hypothetical protein